MADESEVTGEVTIEERHFVQGDTDYIFHDYKTGVYPAKTVVVRRNNEQFIKISENGAEFLFGKADIP